MLIERSIQLRLLAIQSAGLLHGEQPVYVVGGTFETGWPIDPETRLVDCVIAAADLGMFAPLRPIDPERDRPWPQARGTPGGGSWMMHFGDGPAVDAFRRAAHDRGCQPQTDAPRSINEQFVLDWECFMGAIADVLTDELHTLGLIDKSHPG